MKVKELRDELEKVDGEAEVIVVVYTNDGYEAGFVDRIDPNVVFNSVTKERISDNISVVEITTTTRRN